MDKVDEVILLIILVLLGIQIFALSGPYWGIKGSISGSDPTGTASLWSYCAKSDQCQNLPLSGVNFPSSALYIVRASVVLSCIALLMAGISISMSHNNAMLLLLLISVIFSGIALGVWLSELKTWKLKDGIDIKFDFGSTYIVFVVGLALQVLFLVSLVVLKRMKQE
jgi:hypothetical protein